ncbi:MAG: lipocalin family protein [Nitrospira sp.]|nr:lipocalin family protein [Nitrospira sp.]
MMVFSEVFGGCVGMEPRGDLPAVASADRTRDAGTWSEIARLPMWLQRHCVDSRAIYTVRSDERVGGYNECLMGDGERPTADGNATVLDAKTNARFRVVSDNWFAPLFGLSCEGNDWMLDLECRTVLVGCLESSVSILHYS